MVRGIAIATDTCRQPGDGVGLCAQALDKNRLKNSGGLGRRFSFGLPRTDNANYVWIQLFHPALNEKGRAGFVMANSAADARASEQEVRQKQIESREANERAANP